MGTSYYVDTSYGLNAATSGIAGAMLVFVVLTFIVGLALSIFMIISMWKVFEKAGKPGWAAIIPIYNIYVMCEIGNLQWWYILLFLIPIVNIYAAFKVYDGVSKRFGKTTGFTIGLLFLPFVFFAILAFGKNEGIVSDEEQNVNVTQNNETVITNPVDVQMNQQSEQPVIENRQNVQPFNSYQPQGNVTIPNNNVTGNVNYGPSINNMNQPINNTTQEQVMVNNNPIPEQVNSEGQRPTSYFAAHQANNVMPNEAPTIGSVATQTLVNAANNPDYQAVNSMPNNSTVEQVVPTNNIVNEVPTFNEPSVQQANAQMENPLSADNFMIDESMTLDNDVNQNNNQG